MFPFLQLPDLEPWAQQLASILPLAVLLEFADLETKLHVFELSGLNPLWNWPVTPKGARLLSSDEDTSDACCLDRPGRTAELHCMDCKFGNFYPCSAPTTTRLYIKAKSVDTRLKSGWANGLSPNGRKHNLHLLMVTHQPSQKQAGSWLWTIKGGKSKRLFFATACGWIFWLGLLAVSFFAGLYIASAYLASMPLTGLAVSLRFGGQPREPMGGNEVGDINRLAVVTNSVNSCEWFAFYGPKEPINGLLNRPLLRSGNPGRQTLTGWMIRICVASQWGLAIAACVFQGWDAFSVTIWVAFCALTTEHIYPPESAAHDWLDSVCGLKLYRVKIPFTSRRSMLAALVHINPDQENTEWLDPILSKTHQERKDWESATLAYSRTRCLNPDLEKDYWYNFVKEGVTLGVKIQEVLAKRSRSLKKTC
jgi:hypothetical protein